MYRSLFVSVAGLGKQPLQVPQGPRVFVAARVVSFRSNEIDGGRHCRAEREQRRGWREAMPRRAGTKMSMEGGGAALSGNKDGVGATLSGSAVVPCCELCSITRGNKCEFAGAIMFGL
jgi:hypothetical protein